MASLHYSFAVAAGADHTPSGMKSLTMVALLPSDASACANKNMAQNATSMDHKLIITQVWVPTSCLPLPRTQEVLALRSQRASSTARYTVSRARPRACPMAGSEYVSVESSLQARGTACCPQDARSLQLCRLKQETLQPRPSRMLADALHREKHAQGRAQI